jgi:hypothetical protein
LAGLLVAGLVAGCGSSSAAPVSPNAETSSAPSPSAPLPPHEAAAPGASGEPSAKASAPAASAPAPKGSEVLAADSSPPGVTKLSKEEAEVARKSCKPLADALATAAKSKKIASNADRNAFVEKFLEAPPKLAHVDVARCADLILRDLRAYVAATIESEARLNLGRIVVGLATSLEREPPEFCASAGPVPAEPIAAGAPFQSKPGDWAAPGWKCARFDLAGEPQRFQYELVTDPKAGTWEIVARGRPIAGAAATELYSRGRLENGHFQPSRDVYRRAPTK